MMWTDDILAVMEKNWRNGLSASEVAKVIGGGCTRGMVIGHAYRRGWDRAVPSKVGSPQTLWSTAMIATLRTLVKEREARSKIAEIMSLSYDQVVSKVRKLGLAAPDARRYGGQASRAGARASFLQQAAAVGAPARIVNEAPDPTITGLTVMQMPSRGACRWPLTGTGASMVMCGQRCGDGVYCPPHAALAFTAPVMSAARSQRNLERGLRRYA